MGSGLLAQTQPGGPTQKAEKQVRTDLHGDPLPYGAAVCNFRLAKPCPESHVCLAKGAGRVDNARCLELGE
jgi:hypothetical protein